MTIDSDMAALVGFGCEAFLYGAFLSSTSESIAQFSLGCYTVLFAVSIYLMFIGPRRGSRVNIPILIISVLLYLSCSAHFALEFDHFYETLVCISPYQSFSITEYPCSYPQVSMASQARHTPSLALICSSQSPISWANLSSSIVVGCCGLRIMGSSSFRVLLQLRA